MSPLIRFKKATPVFFVVFGLACFEPSPAAQAVMPAPDGGYPGGNTAEGQGALFNLTAGVRNTADGLFALFNETTGNDNTAVGALALLSNHGGRFDTAIGSGALRSNTVGAYNTATGSQALYNNNSQYNTADGVAALFSNTTGFQNTATGSTALFSNTGGVSDTANGAFALFFNTTGSDNTANGLSALLRNTVGARNTADGSSALSSNTTGSNNIAIGFLAGGNLTTGDNNIDIGSPGVAAEANGIRIGTQGTHTATYVAGIFGATVTEGVGVIVDNQGHLGTAVSSERFKKDIATMEKASEGIMSLRPVTFHYKTDNKGTPQFGLIAEEVAKVNPALVLPDKEGKPYTVRYDAVNALLLNEFLKEHRKVEKLEATVAEQQKQIKVLTAGLQKVTARLKTSTFAPQIASNNPR